jgi:LuxR family transcriptional regulator, maltose regulon positive regulatory protein
MARKEHKTTPKVVWQTLYTDSAAVPLGSPLWFEWLSGNATFYLESPSGSFTARRELSGGAAFWYAFRRQRNKLYKAYLGRSADLTHARLHTVARQLAEKADA